MTVRSLGIFILVAAIVIAGGTGVAIMLTRGLRNKNPGNIRFNPNTTWVGQIGTDDKGFVIFDTMENGVRALTKNLRTYFERYNLDTVRSIISRWAPGTENPTDSYVTQIAQHLNVGPDERINAVRIPDLVHGIIRFENGPPALTISESTLIEGIRRAYLG